MIFFQFQRISLNKPYTIDLDFLSDSFTYQLAALELCWSLSVAESSVVQYQVCSKWNFSKADAMIPITQLLWRPSRSCKIGDNQNSVFEYTCKVVSGSLSVHSIGVWVDLSDISSLILLLASFLFFLSFLPLSFLLPFFFFLSIHLGWLSENQILYQLSWNLQSKVNAKLTQQRFWPLT